MATLDIHVIRFHAGFDLPQAKVQEAWEKGEEFKVFAGGPETTIHDLPKWRKDYDTICIWYGNEYKQRFNIDIRERWSTEKKPEEQMLETNPRMPDKAAAYAESLTKPKKKGKK